MFKHTSTVPFALQTETPKPPKRPPQKREKADTKEQRRKYQQMAHQIPMASDEETAFRHSAWATKRKLVHATLLSINTGERQVDAFVQCGSECTVEYCKEEKRYRVRANYCKCRHCEPCNRAKGNLLAANLRKRLDLEPDGRYRFITLTLRHKDAPLTHQLDRLYHSFKRLRADPLWKQSQHGGCAILEVKWDPDTALWHPHLHVISEGGFIAQKDLSAAWLQITGDSPIVDIRALNEGKDAAHYVAKYVSKGTNDAVWYNLNAAQEWIAATKGRRTCATFGKWRGFKLLAHEPETQEWTKIGTLNQLYRDARDGHTYAVKILEAIERDLKYDPHKKRPAKQPPPP